VTSPSTSTPLFNIEYDGSVRPKGVAFAVAASFLDHATPVADISNSSVYAYLFTNRSGSLLAVLWSKNEPPTEAAMGLGASQHTIFDFMGTPVPSVNNKISLDRAPQYVCIGPR
jgi:hypothetical protein